MRLNKKLYILTVIEDAIIGHEPWGEPIYGTKEELSPFRGEVEPYSSGLSQNRYGVSVEVTNRLFCKPHNDIVLGASIRYQNEDYLVTEVMKYDRHYEVLMKKV